MRIVVGISGASGAPYAQRLIEQLVEDSRVGSLSLVLSRTAETVWAHECGGSPRALGLPTFGAREYDAPFASGSAAPDAMVVIPASMSAIARIAQGISDDLLTRAADVTLKERRRLIVVPRELPYSTIHLENMLSLTRAGAMVLPASPSFYHHPRTITELLDTVVGRVRAHLGVPDPAAPSWQGSVRDVRAMAADPTARLRPVAGQEEEP